MNLAARQSRHPYNGPAISPNQIVDSDSSEANTAKQVVLSVFV